MAGFFAGPGWNVCAIEAGAAAYADLSRADLGSGAAFAGAAILALVVPPGAARAIMLRLLMLIDAVTRRRYWRQWDAAAARRLVLAGLPGVALGAALYGAVSAGFFRGLIGAVALAFVGRQGLVAAGLVRPGMCEMPGRAGARAQASSPVAGSASASASKA